MMGVYYILVVSLAIITLAMASPMMTAASGPLNQAQATTTVSPPAVTKNAHLRCTSGSSAVYTTDCTMGTPVSYCWKPPSPIKCQSGEFPSVWHPDHCMEEQTCFPISAAWITTECSNGAIPYATKTLYDGTLAEGKSTVISSVSCACGSNQWYSVAMLDGGSQFDTFCMPYNSCPPGMATSTSIKAYCASATDSTAVAACSDISLESHYCKCDDPMQTPVYPEEPGAAATGLYHHFKLHSRQIEYQKGLESCPSPVQVTQVKSFAEQHSSAIPSVSP
ncbi:hypothetical protein N7523_008499 [Penicillium sp. IBT 18751x]|nr:hypothetical protein N7523_008499 [Penicillium sp. IBT 18751x]